MVKGELSNLGGFYRYTNGDEYEGDLQLNQRNGKGTMLYANGDQYEGEWQNNQMHGVGTMTYSNGDEREGEWRHNRPYLTETINYECDEGHGDVKSNRECDEDMMECTIDFVCRSRKGLEY